MGLILATCLLWNHRFECQPDCAPWHLKELKSGAAPIAGLEWKETDHGLVLRIALAADSPHVGARLLLPGVPPTSFLHVRFRLRAEDLKPGSQPWEDGRLLVDWLPLNEKGAIETDPVGTIRYDMQGEAVHLVVDPDLKPAIPTLRVEHLGRSGAFEISDLELTVLQERVVWRVGKWLLLGAWWLWSLCFMRGWNVRFGAKAALAGVVWNLVGVQCVVPGPWKIIRPIQQEFQLGTENGVARPLDGPPAPRTREPGDDGLVSGGLAPLGEIPVRGSLALQLKLRIQSARPLFHMLMLFVPMFVMSLLIGRWPACGLSWLLAFAIELAQVGFGYGFGWDDIGDLFCDGVGIALAAWVSFRVESFVRRDVRHRDMPAATDLGGA